MKHGKLKYSPGTNEVMQGMECIPDGSENELTSFECHLETCFDGVIESSGAERVNCTKLPLFDNPVSTAKYICDVTIQ